MRHLLTALLALALVGPPVPCEHSGSVSRGACGPQEKPHRKLWIRLGLGLVVVGGGVLAYEVSKPAPLRERRIGGVCCGPGCLLSECHIPPGGY